MGMAEDDRIHFRGITFVNVRDIIDLRVTDAQAAHVAPNATSIAEGLLNPGGWLRAIYCRDIPVGFGMLFDPRIPGALTRAPVAGTGEASVVLWRFMIASQQQGRGFGRQALHLLCGQARRMGATVLLTSYVPGDAGPERFYLRHGFKGTGAFRANGAEPELRLNL